METIIIWYEGFPRWIVWVILSTLGNLTEFKLYLKQFKRDLSIFMVPATILSTILNLKSPQNFRSEISPKIPLKDTELTIDVPELVNKGWYFS